MKFKKETFVFLTALVLIFVLAYINIVLSNNKSDVNQAFDENDLREKQEAFVSDYSDLNDNTGIQITENTDDSDTSQDPADSIDSVDTAEEVSSTESVDIAFENFKISKAQNNLEVVDQLERNISNDLLSAETIKKFEEMLVLKNNQIQMENNIEIMLKSKGYNDVACVISGNNAKIITNIDLKQADAAAILDVVMNETKFEATEIKIVKFNNN